MKVFNSYRNTSCLINASLFFVYTAHIVQWLIKQAIPGKPVRQGNSLNLQCCVCFLSCTKICNVWNQIAMPHDERKRIVCNCIVQKKDRNKGQRFLYTSMTSSLTQQLNSGGSTYYDISDIGTPKWLLSYPISVLHLAHSCNQYSTGSLLQRNGGGHLLAFQSQCIFYMASCCNVIVTSLGIHPGMS